MKKAGSLLDDWYATALFWKPRQVLLLLLLLVNEATLLPVLMPLAPAATAPSRIGQQIAAALAVHQAPRSIIDDELLQMRECRFARTANRSVVGIMNEFTRLADVYRSAGSGQDLGALATRLATTPCSPLYRKHVSPDRELDALLRSTADR
jgi:hypothetical protein